MIWFYSGTNGSGKTLHVSRDIYDRLRNGGTVIANFKVDLSKIPDCKGTFVYVDTYDLSVEYLQEFALRYHDLNRKAKEGQTLVVIDECHRRFNSRDYGNKDRRDWLTFLPEHRKYRYNFILIAPYDRMVDRQIRSLFEYEVVHRKANNFRLIGSILTVLHLQLFWAMSYWYGNKELVGIEKFRYKEKYGCIYDTFAMFDSTILEKIKRETAEAASDGGGEAPVGGPTAEAGPGEVAVTEDNGNQMKDDKIKLSLRSFSIIRKISCKGKLLFHKNRVSRLKKMSVEDTKVSEGP